MKKEIMLHHLRNPYGIDETELKEARLQAASELERLYVIEDKIKHKVATLEEANNKFREW